MLKVWATVDRGPDAIGPAVADRYELGFVIDSGLLTTTNHLHKTLYGYHLSQPFFSLAPVLYTRCHWHAYSLPGLLLQYRTIVSYLGKGATSKVMELF